MEQKQEVKYHSEFYNKCNDTEQWIRITDGCFRNCWNCYCPTEKKVYDLPEVIRNKVRCRELLQLTTPKLVGRRWKIIPIL